MVDRPTSDIAACPNLLGTARHRAAQADRDAIDLADDIRELDPRLIWGRLNRWGQKTPDRLLAVIVSLAAMVDTDHPRNDWVDHIGGTAALHPDYRPAGPPRSSAADIASHTPTVLQLAAHGHSDAEIALRTGLTHHAVNRIRRAAGIHRRPGQTRTADRVRQITELAAAGHRNIDIANRLDIDIRTVQRLRAAADRSKGAA